MAPSDADREEVENDRRTMSMAQELALNRRAPSVYEEMVHPNEESDHDL